MLPTDHIGQTLDQKYRIERELGKGGMGSVYLATHLGTERPVAVKIISPQYMQRAEFVERFRREARAAGRLRHPNVVNVTDFGFAATSGGDVAYLVMEYLDGCTLGEILEEEHNLPVSWTLDILEQVCSAVQEAHMQGIIHRDLKPDNIWLEPNQRGGYTVKVLDFGIAKLEEDMSGGLSGDEAIDISAMPDRHARSTVAGGNEGTIADAQTATLVSEALTMAQGVDENGDGGVMIKPDPETPATTDPVPASGTIIAAGEDAVSTRIIPETTDAQNGGHSISQEAFFAAPSGRDLTRVGSVLGTPLYMSPEQCRGEKLDARSDIYSLGVIAYQMLSGRTPFEGDFKDVMKAHEEVPAPPLHARKVRRKLRQVIDGALEKDPDLRPQTAEAFANQLRSRSEGIYMLLRRAAMIYTEQMPKFLILSAFFSLPMIVLTTSMIIFSFLRVSEILPAGIASVMIGINAFFLSVFSAFCAYLTVGTITWIVTQFLAVPLRPLKIRASLKEARKKWRTFAGTGIVTTFLIILSGAASGGLVFALVALLWAGIRPMSLPMDTGVIFAACVGIIAGGLVFWVVSVNWMLVGPVVMMENMRGRQALKRSSALVKRAFVTAAAAFVIMFMIPLIAAGSISFVVNVTAKALQIDKATEKPTVDIETSGADATGKENPSTVSISIGDKNGIAITGTNNDMESRLKNTLLETLLQILLLPIQIVVTSFTAIIVALLYLKTRQAGGERMEDLLFKFDENDRPRKKWQERVRRRLVQSGRVTSKT
jgi:serine/threonine protein kinase